MSEWLSCLSKIQIHYITFSIIFQISIFPAVKYVLALSVSTFFKLMFYHSKTKFQCFRSTQKILRSSFRFTEISKSNFNYDHAVFLTYLKYAWLLQYINKVINNRIWQANVYSGLHSKSKFIFSRSQLFTYTYILLMLFICCVWLAAITMLEYRSIHL